MAFESNVVQMENIIFTLDVNVLTNMVEIVNLFLTPFVLVTFGSS